ncbi:MAG: sulfatase family protein, partial [Planctomycetota bacterium]
NGVYAIRCGPWKWIEGVPLARPGKKPPRRRSPKGDQFRPQLINLQNDPGETQDVSAQHPDVVKRLSETLRLQREQGFSRL